jgi:hypothetical protein
MGIALRQTDSVLGYAGGAFTGLVFALLRLVKRCRAKLSTELMGVLLPTVGSILLIAAFEVSLQFSHLIPF